MDFLDDYLSYIGFQIRPTADLDTLRQIHALHPASIAFENIDVLLDKGIDLNLNAITQKLISHKRGGYCFEHNGLLMAVLQQIGFSVEPLMARAVWRQPDNTPLGPRTHLVLKVTIDGKPWLADVGFGGLVLTDPLRLDTETAQEGRHERFRLLPHEHGYQLQVEVENKWEPLYDIGGQPLEPIDIEVANWYTSANPQTKFRHNLMAARATPETRYSLLNNRFTLRPRGQAPVQKILTPTELAETLSTHFLLPVAPEWRPLLEQICQKS